MTAKNPVTDQKFYLESLLSGNFTRRQLIKGGLSSAAMTFLGCAESIDEKKVKIDPDRSVFPFGFASVPVAEDDNVRIPQGYEAEVLIAWGDPIAAGARFNRDGSNSAADQILQCGMHHDGMEYFPLPVGSHESNFGLLCINNEYLDEGLLHTDGFANWSIEKVRKSQAAVGVTIVCVRNNRRRWEVVRPSSYARRITANTPIRISGPAAGDVWLKTSSDPSGRMAFGTLANCACGQTPWGTYLTCEENWHGYFAHTGATKTTDPIPSDYQRYRVGLPAFDLIDRLRGYGFGSRWFEFDRRFDTAYEPHEPNRFGWVVEIDPYDSKAMPVKRTALGRLKHESATVTLSLNGQVVVYTGDDEQFEYIYKFVSDGKFNLKSREANRDLLDHGTLYVAKFNDDGSGSWLPLVYGLRGLVESNGFKNQAEVLIKTRQAADQAGATKMDRPEWIAINPQNQDVFCTLTNNAYRGRKSKIDAANPRVKNIYGHILRWREANNNSGATEFNWDIFVLCGDPSQSDADNKGNIKGDIFCCPDGLRFDDRGLLWIATDLSTNALNKGAYKNFGNNQLLVADVNSGTIKRFLTGPKGCEVTGMRLTPDLKTLFVNIQHPGELGKSRSDPNNPTAISAWPDGERGGRPRSATLAIRKSHGGVIAW